jgi:hypothetical protein
MKSEFDKINKVKVSNAIYHAIGAGAFPLIGFISAGKFPTQEQYLVALGACLGAFMYDIFKQKIKQ